MTNSHQNRRNFLSTIAILSAGSALGSSTEPFSLSQPTHDLQNNWATFWKKSGGQKFYSLADLNSSIAQHVMKGHFHTPGSIIYFPKENILAQPTWICWQNDRTKPTDLLVTFFNNDHSFKKIICFNRYEMEALYSLSKVPGREKFLLAFLNNKHGAGGLTGVVKIKTNIKKNGQIQDISYYEGKTLVFEDKVIHHT